MTQQTTLNTGADARRAAVEAIIRRYPDLTPQELSEVLHYLRKEASILDRATIASDEAIEPQYRSLCHDHYLSRPRPLAIWVGTGLLALIVLAAILVFPQLG